MGGQRDRGTVILMHVHATRSFTPSYFLQTWPVLVLLSSTFLFSSFRCPADITRHNFGCLAYSYVISPRPGGVSIRRPDALASEEGFVPSTWRASVRTTLCLPKHSLPVCPCINIIRYAWLATAPSQPQRNTQAVRHELVP